MVRKEEASIPLLAIHYISIVRKDLLYSNHPRVQHTIPCRPSGRREFHEPVQQKTNLISMLKKTESSFEIHALIRIDSFL